MYYNLFICKILFEFKNKIIINNIIIIDNIKIDKNMGKLKIWALMVTKFIFSKMKFLFKLIKLSKAKNGRKLLNNLQRKAFKELMFNADKGRYVPIKIYKSFRSFCEQVNLE